ncbi:MAG: alkaline phosphatase family protein [Christensenellaceae bacterium]
MKDIAQGKYVTSGGKKMSFKEFPDFMAVYFDDIDSLGHNNDYGDVPKRHNFEDRQKDIIDCLVEFQQELDEFINICKSTGLYNDLIILIATDHGMTPFFGKSKLSDVLDLINKSGIKADSAFDFDSESQIIALPYTIELSLYFIKPLTSSQRERLISLLESKDYVDRVFVKEEMEKNYGFDERGPDMLISPTYGSNIKGLRRELFRGKSRFLSRNLSTYFRACIRQRK